MIILFLLIEWIGREKQYAIAELGFGWPRLLRLSFYYAIIFLIFYIGGAKQNFIYFQF